MAKGNCPICGGNVMIGAKVDGVFKEGATPKRGARNWKCKQDGDDPNCKGWGFYGNKRETSGPGTAEGQSQQIAGTAEPAAAPAGPDAPVVNAPTADDHGSAG